MSKMPVNRAILIFICMISLSACVTRDQADDRLSDGCTAAAGLFIDDGFTIKKIKRTTFNKSMEFGQGYREVMIFAIESDGWLDIDKEYKCIFAEEFGAFNSTHRASIYQVKINGQIYGKDGDKILGDIKTHIKLNDAVEESMKKLK